MPRLAAVAVVCAGALTLSIGGAFAHDDPNTVAAVGGADFKPNQQFTIGFRWDPGKINVRTGETVTWENRVDPLVAEEHTITIADEDALPKTIEDLVACQEPDSACGPAFGHFDPTTFEPIPGKEVIDPGNDGFNAVGDSLRLAAPDGGDVPTISAKITAPAGTELYYLCAIHPWMQGEIDVRKARD